MHSTFMQGTKLAAPKAGKICKWLINLIHSLLASNIYGWKATLPVDIKVNVVCCLYVKSQNVRFVISEKSSLHPVEICDKFWYSKGTEEN